MQIVLRPAPFGRIDKTEHAGDCGPSTFGIQRQCRKERTSKADAVLEAGLIAENRDGLLEGRQQPWSGLAALLKKLLAMPDQKGRRACKLVSIAFDHQRQVEQIARLDAVAPVVTSSWR